ncbi:MAG: hypothetical protein WCA63_05820 [Gallionella sp.]
MNTYFEGNVDARWLVEDGADRKMQLLADFSFIDSTHFKWEAKTGDIIDGASIPEAIWSEICRHTLHRRLSPCQRRARRGLRKENQDIQRRTSDVL